MINWQQPKQDICWPVSCYNIRGSGQELIEVMCFLEVDRWPGTGFQLNHRHEPGYYSAERRRKYMCFFTLIPQYSLHNCLFESPWYIAYIISTILGTVMRYSLLKKKKKNWKKNCETTHWTNRAQRHIEIVTVQSLSCLRNYYSKPASCQPELKIVAFVQPLGVLLNWSGVDKLVLWSTWRLNFMRIYM